MRRSLSTAAASSTSSSTVRSRPLPTTTPLSHKDPQRRVHSMAGGWPICGSRTRPMARGTLTPPNGSTLTSQRNFNAGAWPLPEGDGDLCSIRADGADLDGQAKLGHARPAMPSCPHADRPCAPRLGCACFGTTVVVPREAWSKPQMDGGADARRITIHAREDFVGMRAAGRLAAEALDMITEHVRPGIATGTLDTLCHEFIIAHDAVPAPLNYRGYPKSICTSINHVVCHGIPGERKPP